MFAGMVSLQAADGLVDHVCWHGRQRMDDRRWAADFADMVSVQAADGLVSRSGVSRSLACWVCRRRVHWPNGESGEEAFIQLHVGQLENCVGRGTGARGPNIWHGRQGHAVQKTEKKNGLWEKNGNVEELQRDCTLGMLPVTAMYACMIPMMTVAH
eukprot:scaffold24530_cov22-Tisochrysis_lutea.AAC.1